MWNNSVGFALKYTVIDDSLDDTGRPAAIIFRIYFETNEYISDLQIRM